MQQPSAQTNLMLKTRCTHDARSVETEAPVHVNNSEIARLVGAARPKNDELEIGRLAFMVYGV